MKTKRITVWFIFIVIAIIVVYDVFAAVCWGWSATISDTVRVWAGIHPALPCLVALFMIGLWIHFFIQKNK